jgi:hypothetical protein
MRPTGRNGAQGRNAFAEALESYQQVLALLNLLPESGERVIAANWNSDN